MKGDEGSGMENPFFEFEADFVKSLRCIPMIVRFKLDQCGIKLSLKGWSRFNLATRETLTYAPTTGPEEIEAYRLVLCRSLEEMGEKAVPIAVDPQPLWMAQDDMPEVVVQKVQEMAHHVNGSGQWKNLNSLQRFALIKLTRGGHENENFIPALREFGLTA